MELSELPVEYFKLLAKQMVFISVFLGGISATILGTLVLSNNNSKLLKWMILFISIAAVSFIVSVFGLNKVLIILAPDSPYSGSKELLAYPRMVGSLATILGIYNLLTVIGLSGWIKSKKIGWITTIISIVAALLIFTLI